MTTAIQPIAPEDLELKDLSPSGLTPEQEAKWADTMSLMAWTCPGFRHLFYKLLSNNNGKYACVPTSRVPVAATDAKNILINPDTFFKYELRQRVFIIGHEIVHNVYQDVPYIYRCRQSQTVTMDDGTTLPFNEDVMQRAMDYRINALLRDSKIGVPPDNVLLDDNIATANDGITDAYKKLYEDYEKNGTMPGGGFDLVLQPGTSTGQNPGAQVQNPQQWAVEVKAAQTIEAMRSQGKMAGALQRMFNKVLNPQVPWTDHIRGIFNRKVGSGNYNWRKPDRRFITRDLYMPSRSGNGAGHVVVWADTSGSIGTTELCHYLAELASIVDDCKPERLTVIWCDAEIHRIDEIAEASDMAQLQYDAQANGVGGGGGTSVGPVFEWINQQVGRPEVFIGFTDGYVSFPKHAPDFLSIWASTTDHDYPWGEVVRINPTPDY
jgi:predicted metal-dependent peptidase